MKILKINYKNNYNGSLCDIIILFRGKHYTSKAKKIKYFCT